MRRPTFVLLAALWLVPATASAQHRAGLALVVSDPRGDFAENTDTGFGLGAWYRYAIGPGRALSIGVDGSFQQYGSARRRAPLSTTIPEIQVRVETSNQTSYLMGALELEAPAGTVRPYALTTGGFGFFFTTTSLKDPLTRETVLTDTNQSDWTWVWSAGGGLRFQVHERPRPERAPYRVWVDLGATRLWGGEVEYLREGTLVTDRGEVDIDRRLARSEIELIQYRIGATFEF